MDDGTINSLAGENSCAEIDYYLTTTGGQEKAERFKLIDKARALSVTRTSCARFDLQETNWAVVCCAVGKRRLRQNLTNDRTDRLRNG